MAGSGGKGRVGAGALFAIADEIPDRVELHAAPDAHLFSTFFVTRAAARALARIEAALAEPCGKLFWIGGAPGTGKTHFLNYLFGLEAKAAPLQAHRGRHLTFTAEMRGRMRGDRLETCVLEALARALGGDDPRAVMNWHGARGADALSLAIGQARRLGVRAISGFIDLGAEQEAGSEYLRVLGETAAGSRHLRLTIFAAARTPAPEFAIALDGVPADPAEKLRAAIARARTMRDGADEAAQNFYRAIGIDVDEADTIFPFHPDALEVLDALSDPPGTLATLAILARDILVAAEHAGGPQRLIYPCDLIAAEAVQNIARSRIGEAGWTAVGIARDSIEALAEHERAIAEQIVATLVLHRAASGDRPIPISRLERLLPSLAGAGAAAQVLDWVSASSAGVIRLDSEGAVLDPAAAGAPTLAAFNNALALVKRFAPEIADRVDAGHIGAAESRLDEAMAEAAEKAARTADVLRSGLAAHNLEFPDEHRRTIEQYLDLAGAGARALEEAGSDPARREHAARVVSDYEALAAAAEMVPQMRAMREYLERTGLHLSYQDNPARDPSIAALETECQLLAGGLTPRLLLHPPRSLDALRARFQKFRWDYAAAYQSAHSAWREEMKRVAALAENLRLHAAALEKLNAIAALGRPESEDSAAAAARISASIKQCEIDGPLAIELVPRCAGCGYVLGARSPRAEISDLTNRIRAAIERKLAILSQTAIARIIHQHDHAGRLEGFLKITQAAQTDALVRVLDDNLASYLARLLEENFADAHHRAAAPLFGDSPGNGAHRRRTSHNGGAPKRPRHPRG